MSEPDTKQKVAYYVLGLTPPVEHADWVRADVDSTAWLVRRSLQLLAGLVLGLAIAATLFGYRPGLFIGGIIGGIIGSLIQVLFMRGYLRRRTHGYYEKKWAKQRA